MTTTTPNPLIEIERSVQNRAKLDDLAMGDSSARDALRSMVREEIGLWNDQFKRGQRPFELADTTRAEERALRNLTGYGPLETLLTDDDVWEIMVNAPDTIFVKRHRGNSGYHDEVFHDDDHVTRTMTKILDDAGTAHRKLDPSEGLQDAQLEDGSRIHIVHGDIARGGHMMVNIRKFTGVTIRSLDELVQRSSLSGEAAKFLKACIGAKQTIIFAGAPGSGKTTLLNCCAAELDPSLRVVTAEEVFEADVALPNVASMQTRASRSDRPEIDLRHLVAGFLRMAPDIAIVGEVRDREALPLLLTLSSGVKGFTTIHAGSGRQALTRLRFICQLAETSNELPMSALTSLVSESVDVVVYCERTPSGPQVQSIVCVEDLTAGNGATFTTTEVFERAQPNGELRWSGDLPARVGSALAAAGRDLRLIFGSVGVR